MNSYQPYSPDELTELEKLQQFYGQPAAAAPAPAAPNPLAPPAYQPPSLPEATAPLDTGVTTPSTTAPKGTALKEIKVEGIDPAQYAKLQALHQQLTGSQIDAAHQSAEVEQGIGARNVNEALARERALAEQQTKQQTELLQHQQAEKKIRNEQEAWAAKKEDGSEAFRGHELAGVLAAIGIAAGTFSQAMGWQGGNPVKQMFDETVNRTIASQKEEKESRLKMLTARFGDEQAAESVVRSELHQTIADKLAEHQKGILNQDTIARLAPIQAQQENKAKEEQLAAIEKLAPKQTVTNEAVKPKGPQTLEQQLKDQEAGQQLRQGKISALIATGLDRESAEQVVDTKFPALSQYKGETTKQREEIQARAEREAARKEAEAKLTPEEKKDFRSRVDGLASALKGFKEFDAAAGIGRDGTGHPVIATKAHQGELEGDLRGLAKSAAGSLPWGMGAGIETFAEGMSSDEYRRLERRAEKITSGLAHAESGAQVGDKELERYGRRLPLDRASTTLEASTELYRDMVQKYKSTKADYEKRGLDIDAELRAQGIDPREFGGG